MTTVEMMQKRFILYDIGKEIVVILKNGDKILFEVQKNQWLHGQNSKGQKLSKDGYANSAYAKMKFNKNPLAGSGNMDLILTGKTIDSLKVTISSDIINFELQSDEHGLIGRFGKEILGLNSEGRFMFIQDYLLKAIYESINAKTGAK